MPCPTCDSEKKEVRKLTHIPGTGESDLAPVALWDPCWDTWHGTKEKQLLLKNLVAATRRES
jgi:hypothetical protein